MLLVKATISLLLLLHLNVSFSMEPLGLIAANDMNCYGGGVKYVSPYYSLEYYFDEFKDKNPYCIPPEDTTKYGEDFSERKISIDQFIDRILKNNQCTLFHDVFKTFIKARDSIFMHVDRSQPKRMLKMKDFMDEIKSDIHIEQAALARDVNFCGSSDISIKIWPYWFLLTKLKELLENVPPSEEITVIQKDGDTASTCQNVMANGTEDLEKFFVKIPKNLKDVVDITFHAYQIKDQLSVYAKDKKLYDTGCVPDDTNYKINKAELEGIDQLEFKVKAKCAGDNGTVWDIKVDCDLTPPPVASGQDDPCSKQIRELIIILESMMKTYYPIQNYYWMNVVCHHENYEKLTTDFPPPPTALEVLSDDQCKNKRKCNPDKHQQSFYSKKKQMLSQKTVLQRKPEPKGKTLKNETLKKTGDDEMDSVVFKLESTKEIKKEVVNHRVISQTKENQQADKIYFHLQRYLDNKELYCQNINNELELFDRISKRYCLTGYSKLLPNNP